jgi:membrane-bound serine protease (ClpP class)
MERIPKHFLKTLPFLAVFLLAALAVCGANASEKSVHWVEAEGIVDPIMAEYLTTSISRAEDQGAEAIIIQLDTPGGLDLSMRKIVKKILGAEVPVVVYVAPAGSRAASAGVFIAYASNVAAMAPGTNIGSAHPVAMGGEKMDETMMKKVENDAAAYIMGIAAKRGRNAKWAELAVRESVNITAEDALKLKVIEIVATDRAALLEKLDGRKVQLPSGPRTLSTKGVLVVEVRMNLRHRILSAISNPNVAYILMMLGLIGLYFELSNPGAILPGVIGAVCLVLAFYAFQTLSINYAGLILIGLAIIFFIIEISVVSYGLLTIAGIVTLLLGSLMLFDAPEPSMRLSIWVVLPMVVFMSVFIVGTMYYAVRLHRRGPVSGVEGLVGTEGTAIEDMDAGMTGKVFVNGEYWNAISDGPVANGDRVRIVEVKGLQIKVRKV